MVEQISVPGTDSETKKDGDAEPRQTGMALEIDVLKKVHHQLSRLEDSETIVRVLGYLTARSRAMWLQGQVSLVPNAAAVMPRAPSKTDDEFGFGL
jgi:hypothetical protein